MIARTLSSPRSCWVTPIDQTNTARDAPPTMSAKASISSRETPATRSSDSQSVPETDSARAPNPLVCPSMKSS